MGDMGDVFNAWKAMKQQAKVERLAKADDKGWFKHSQWHWSIKGKDGRIDYWPSTGLVMHKGQKMGFNSKRAKELIYSAME